ncbi:unnamed protein product [Owenia fusiformis]|uniref:Ig-like domain-containing protein n=1 Tax=Owenia fusiformis TaxID=6347 RepID=A0A8S4N7A4_OWEFU|nr:unnamed protein product [Owenia fusiformis]
MNDKMAKLLLPLALVLMTCVHLSSAQCFTGCYCNEETREVLCGKDLTSFPYTSGLIAEPTRLQIKCQDGFEIPSLKKSDLDNYIHLTRLELLGCGLQDIADDVFDSLTEVIFLGLGNNKLSSIHQHTFSKLTQLTTLLLHQNELTEIPDNAFIHLTNLKTVRISDNKLKRIGKHAFEDIPSLQNLWIEGNPELTEVDKLAFASSSIEYLTIGGADLSEDFITPLKHLTGLKNLRWNLNKRPINLPVDSFESFDLTSLDLSGNQMSSHRFLEKTRARTVRLHDNLYTSIDFLPYTLPNTTYLGISRNKISTLDASKIGHLKTLMYLELDDNLIDEVTGTLSSLTNLVRFAAGRNRIQHLPEGFFKENTQLQKIELEENLIDNLNGAMFPVQNSLTSLEFNDNRIERISDDMEPILRGNVLTSNSGYILLYNNPLHCNCEMKWLKQLVNEKPSILEHPFPRNIETICASSSKPIKDMESADMVCTTPSISHMTHPVGNEPWKCTAIGDPAPAVEWLNPDGDVIAFNNPTSRGAAAVSVDLPQEHVPVGTFTCVAKSDVGEAKAQVYLMGQENDVCPTGCNCDEIGKSVSCGTGLTAWPQDSGLEGVKSLVISCNDGFEIPHVTTSNFDNYPSLTRLSLNNCGTQDISDDVFNLLTEVTFLGLPGNKITYVHQNTFSKLTKLKTLLLQGNLIEEIPDNAFIHLRELTTMRMSDNKLKKIGKNAFADLTQLKNLWIEGNPELSDVDDDAFTDSHIDNLSIDGDLDEGFIDSLAPLKDMNTLQWKNNARAINLPADSFVGFDFQSLDLSNNQLENLDFLENLKAGVLRLDNCGISSIDFTQYDLPTTTFLSVQNNQITSVDLNQLDHITTLNYLYLSYNAITEVKGTLEPLSELLQFSIAKNQLKEIPQDLFKKNPKIIKFEFDNNEIETISGSMFPDDTSVRFLELFSNHLQTIPDDMEPIVRQGILDSGYFHIHENPLHCNCELRWLKDLLEEKPTILDYMTSIQYDVLCTTPKVTKFKEMDARGLECSSPVIEAPKVPENGDQWLCKASGDPAPTVEWKTAAGVVVAKTEPHTRSDPSVSVSLPKSSEEPGTLTCTARSSYGSSTASVVITDNKMASRAPLIALVLFSFAELSSAQCFTGCACDEGKGDVICGTGLTAFPRDSGMIAEPTNLQITCKDGFQIPHLTKTDFDNYKHLTRLYIQECGLLDIADDVFELLTEVTYLSLSYNKLSSIHQHTFSQLTNLVTLMLFKNEITEIPDNAFIHLQNLRTVSLTNNKLKRIGKHAFKDLPDLRNLWIQDNPELAEVDDLAFADSSITFLTIGATDLTEDFINPLKHLTKLSNLRWTHNKRPITLPADSFETFGNLVSLDLRSNQMTSHRFLEKTSAQMIRLDGNLYTTLDFLPYTLPNITYLTMERNKITKLDTSQIAHLKSLRSIDLDDNLIDEITGTLSPLHSLERFSAARNKIQHLPEGFFKENTQLQRIELEENVIDNLNGAMFPTENSLYIFEFHSNNIETIPSDMDAILRKNMIDRTDAYFMIYDNPLHCNCELGWLRQLLNEKPGLLDNPRFPKNIDTVCASSSKPIQDMETSEMVCATPSITHITHPVGNAHWKCTAIGDPAPAVKWLNPDGDVIAFMNPTSRGDESVSIDLPQEHAPKGTFTCVAKSDVGEAQAHVFLVGQEEDYCATGCVCDEVYKSVTCGEGLQEWPQEPGLDDVASLIITCQDGFEIPHITKSHFDNYPSLTRLSLNNCGTQDVSDDVFDSLTDVTFLGLPGNKITYIHQNTFSKLFHLKTLLLQGNLIEEIPENAFIHLHNLTTMRMSDNKLKRIGKNAFADLTHMRNLWIENNPELTDVDKDAFADSHINYLAITGDLDESFVESLAPLKDMKTLIWTDNARSLDLPVDSFTGFEFLSLDLSNSPLDNLDFLENVRSANLKLDNCGIRNSDFTRFDLPTTSILSVQKNKITFLDLDQLAHISTLRYLLLSENDITEIKDTLESFPDLVQFSMAKNKLKKIPQNLFKNNPKIVKLEFEYNEIEEISGSMFPEESTIRYFEFFGNHIQTIPDDMDAVLRRTILDTFGYFHIHENPLHCNCELKWLKDLLEEKPTIFDFGTSIQHDVMCTTPKVTKFKLLDSAELTCLSPVIEAPNVPENNNQWVCKAAGDPAPTVEWRTAEDVVVASNEPHKRGDPFVSVSLPKSSEEDGTFTCVASSTYGSSTASVTLEDTSSTSNSAKAVISVFAFMLPSLLMFNFLI